MNLQISGLKIKAKGLTKCLGIIIDQHPTFKAHIY